ncbi:hypothetical protein V8E36_003972 [Tilletia maclaganii]
MTAFVNAVASQLRILPYSFAIGAFLFCWTQGLAVTVHLHQANISTLLHSNGTLNDAGLSRHIRHIQHRYCLAQHKHHYCGETPSSLYNRDNGQVSINTGPLEALPTIPISVGGQAFSVVFDTIYCRHRLHIGSGVFVVRLVPVLSRTKPNSTARRFPRPCPPPKWT